LERVAGGIKIQLCVGRVELAPDPARYVGNGFGSGGFGNCNAGVFQNPRISIAIPACEVARAADVIGFKDSID
jgi:hypothetical protein